MWVKRNLLLLNCFIILAITACLSPDEEIRINQERGNKIIEVLEDYNRDHGQFPKNLELLVPDYLSEIPKTITDKEFIYGLGGLDGYYFGFDVTSRPTLGCGYSYRWKKWECSYGDH